MNQSNNSKNSKAEKTAEVLYQRLGNRWYAFSMIDEDVFVGSINEEELNAICLDNPENVASPRVFSSR